ncbi:uncharacterized protein LOC128260370 [Drosophila gunungcola]|uniref:uncharacterized protein LOC128260370 n=1 Tax=Drosophila gunungcola TaxID=103775 RepID=UPI0022E3DA34|nr:uncharacterized protein LOC128260370 [Drosophila gunungcola]
MESIYLHFLGFLLFLAVSGSSLDRELINKRLNENKNRLRQLTVPSPKQRWQPVLTSLLQRDYNDNKPIIRKDLFPDHGPLNHPKAYTPFEKRVIVILIKLELLDNEAEQVLAILKQDKEMVNRLKKWLDEVDTENESKDFLKSFFNLIFKKKVKNLVL